MTLVDTAAIALLLDTTVNAVRILAHRRPDALPRRGRDSRGRTLYAIEDAEHIRATRLTPA